MGGCRKCWPLSAHNLLNIFRAAGSVPKTHSVAIHPSLSVTCLVPGWRYLLKSSKEFCLFQDAQHSSCWWSVSKSVDVACSSLYTWTTEPLWFDPAMCLPIFRKLYETEKCVVRAAAMAFEFKKRACVKRACIEPSIAKVDFNASAKYKLWLYETEQN